MSMNNLTIKNVHRLVKCRMKFKYLIFIIYYYK